jgi:hypothetical protein
MADAPVPVGEVQIRYQLSPLERIVAGLLFGRRYRVVGSLGAVYCLLALIPSFSVWAVVLMPAGLTFLTSFLWLPLITGRRQPPIDITATAEGLEFGAGTTVPTLLSWRGVRRMRVLLGYLALDTTYRTIAIPCRTLQQRQMSMLQGFLVASRSTTPPVETASAAAEDGVILSFIQDARFFDILLALAWRPVNAAFVVLGLTVVAVSIRDTTVGSGPGYDPQSYWLFVGFGVFVMLAPILSVLLRAYLAGGTRAFTERFQIDITPDGYRASNARSSTCVAWGSFRSARRVRQVMVFRMTGSSTEVCLSTRGFRPDQLAAFRAVLRTHGLDPG